MSSCAYRSKSDATYILRVWIVQIVGLDFCNNVWNKIRGIGGPWVDEGPLLSDMGSEEAMHQ